MSSQDWAEYGFGLVFSERDKTLDTLIKNVAREAFATEDETELEAFDVNDVAEYFDGMEGSVRYYDEEMSGKSFHPAVTGHGSHFKFENMLVFWANNAADVFSAVYTKESVVDEFKEKIGRYLPDDFDYLAHIGYFSCCICC